MAQIVDGGKIAGEILKNLRIKVVALKQKPKLVVFVVGNNPASLSFIKLKRKKAAEIGIEVDLRRFAENVSQEEIMENITAANVDHSVSGIIVQLPIPKNLNREQILNAVEPKKDVDCLAEASKFKLSGEGQVFFEPPAPAAILKILDFHEVDLAKSRLLLIGSGELVGKPLAALLLKRKVSFELANRSTENLSGLTAKADVIVAAAGRAKLVTGDMVRDGVIVIDAGTTGSESGEIQGDVDFASVEPKARLVSPVPGGVGPVTVAMLLRNVVAAAEAQAAQQF